MIPRNTVYFSNTYKINLTLSLKETQVSSKIKPFRIYIYLNKIQQHILKKGRKNIVYHSSSEFQIHKHIMPSGNVYNVDFFFNLLSHFHITWVLFVIVLWLMRFKFKQGHLCVLECKAILWSVSTSMVATTTKDNIFISFSSLQLPLAVLHWIESHEALPIYD